MSCDHGGIHPSSEVDAFIWLAGEREWKLLECLHRIKKGFILLRHLPFTVPYSRFMYCSSCGAESLIELNYCKRCGANLAPTEPVAETTPVTLTKPILIVGSLLLFITLGGFAAVLSSAIEIVRRGGAGDVSMAIVFLGMVVILTVDILLSVLLWKLVNAALSSQKTSKAKQLSPPKDQARLSPPTTAQVEPARSVTENTTRFFEPVYRDPRRSNPREEIKK